MQESDRSFKTIYKEHVYLRNLSLHKLKLPYAKLRPGQKDLLQEITAALIDKTTYLLNAPTGFGKTFVCLAPALACLAKDKIKRIYYFTNQESQRDLPANFLNELRKLNQLQFWSQTLYSSERCCKQHDFCYLNYNKLTIKQTVETLLRTFNGHIDFATLQTWANQYKLCPYLLQIELANYMDLLILDYNYLFDPLQQLSSLKKAEGPLALLFDEAHNLPARGKEMFQVTLSLQDFISYAKMLDAYILTSKQFTISEQNKANLIELKQLTNNLANYFKELTKLCLAANGVDKKAISKLLNLEEAEIIVSQTENTSNLYTRQSWPKLGKLLTNFIAKFTEFVKSEQSQLVSSYAELRELRDKLTKLKRLNYLLSNYQPSFIGSFHWRKQGSKPYASLAIHCLDAMPLLRQSLPSNAGKIFFSATLLPLDYYEQLFSEPNAQINSTAAKSPFPVENRKVAILSYANLTYQNRDFNAKLIAKSLLAYLKQIGGHLLVFAPSYRYAAKLQQALSQIWPSSGYNLISQMAKASLKAKQAFINTLKDTSDKRPLLALAVLQSSYSEGLDLPGASITGIAIISVSYPAKSDLLSLQQAYFAENYRRESNFPSDDNQILMADYYEEAPAMQKANSQLPSDPAYLFTQLYPSFNKIVQACGRLIRTETDKGEIMLFDERFTRAEYQPLLKAAFSEYCILPDLNSYVDWLKKLKKHK